MQSAQELVDSIPDLTPSVDLQALAIWLERQGYTLEQIKVGGVRASRPKFRVEARRLVAEFLRARGWSYPMISDLLGYAEHTGAMYLIRSRRSA